MSIKQDQEICSNCNKTFELKKYKNLYRCGDTYVCSQKCSFERYHDLKQLDPGLTRPHTWPLLKTESSSTLFDYEYNLSPNSDFETSNSNESIPTTKIIQQPTVITESNCSDILNNCCSQTYDRCFAVGTLCIICVIIVSLNN